MRGNVDTPYFFLNIKGKPLQMVAILNEDFRKLKTQPNFKKPS